MNLLAAIQNICCIAESRQRTVCFVRD